MNRYTFTFLLLFASGTLLGQSVIKGEVTNGNQPVPFATVQIIEKSIGTYTDENGQFQLANNTDDDITLKISAVGYRTQTQNISSNPTEQLKINLEEDLLNLNDVVVSGTRYESDRSEAPVVVNVVGKQILNATQSLSIADGLNFQPGVRVETNCQNCGFTQVRLNGLEGSYSQILINSRAVFSSLNSVYGLEQIPSSIVEKIEVVRGGGSALYGSNAIAGTINIITREPIINSWEAGSNLSLIDGQSWDYTTNFNTSLVDRDLKKGMTVFGLLRNRDAYDANSDGFTELTSLNNRSIGTKAFYRFNDRSKLTLDASYINEYRRGGSQLSLEPELTDITEELAHDVFTGGLTWDYWSKNKNTKVTPYVSGQLTKRDSYYGGLGGGRTAEDSLLASNAYGETEDWSLVSGIQTVHFFQNGNTLTLGAENQFNKVQDDILGYERSINQSVNSTGVFGQFEWKPTSKFSTLMGTRLDFVNVEGLYELGNISRTSNINLTALSPRLTILYKPYRNIQFRAGYARGFRAPQAFNEDLHISSVGGEPKFTILSEELIKETSDAFTVSMNITRDFGFTQTNLLIEGFYTDLRNPFTLINTGATLTNGSIIEEVVNGQGAIVSGVNFEGGISPSPDLSFFFGGTIQTSRYKESQVLFSSVGSGEDDIVINEFIRNPNTYGYFTSSWNPTNKWAIDFTGTYTGVMMVPRVIREDGFLELNETDPFLDINLKLSRHLEVSDNFHLELSGGVKNLLNSYQDDFDIGATRDSDYVYGPALPRSVFFSLKMSNMHF